MLVVDASVAVKFVVAEEGSVEAASLLRSSEPLIAPDWMLAEVGHALWKKVREQSISQETAVAALGAMPAFFQDLHPTAALLDGAYALAFGLEHWLYDCLYLELANREDAVVVTADKKFRNAAVRNGLGERVLLLGAEA